MIDLIDRQATLNALMEAVKSVGVLDADDIKTVFDMLPSVQQEKAQLSLEGTTSDLISRTATIDAVNNAFDRETLLTGFVRSIAVRAIRDMPSVQPEPSIPVAWIEGQIERLNNTDNYFAKLTANIIKTMLNEWKKGEQK
jgi:hypothetical protein